MVTNYFILGRLKFFEIYTLFGYGKSVNWKYGSINLNEFLERHIIKDKSIENLSNP